MELHGISRVTDRLISFLRPVVLVSSRYLGNFLLPGKFALFLFCAERVKFDGVGEGLL